MIIPTLGRQELVGDVLRDLALQTVKPIVVLVVDQTPESETSAAAYDRFQEALPVRIIRLDTKGTCVSRNAAIQETKTPLVLLLDDDLRFQPDLIASHLQVMKETGADVVHGGVAGPDGVLPEQSKHNESWDPAWSLLASANDRTRKMCIGVASGNLLLKREWLQRIGGFDEWFNDGNGDDFDLGLRLFRAGAIQIYDPRPVVTHLRASSGGRRQINRFNSRFSAFVRPEPPPTTPYFYMKHFPGLGPKLLFLNHLLRIYSRRNLSHPWVYLVGPIRLVRSWRQARRMVEIGPRSSLTQSMTRSDIGLTGG